jgi:hypothetical protein
MNKETDTENVSGRLATSFAIVVKFAALLIIGCLTGCGEDDDSTTGGDVNATVPARHLTVRVTGTTRVLIQQLAPPADLLVGEMKAGEEAKAECRGRFKVFCSRREFIELTVDGEALPLPGEGPGAQEF